MKVVLYMAMTVNGMIAKEDDDTSFTSEAEWESFRAHVNKAGNMVVGHRTYDVMSDGGGFDGLEKVTIVVVSHHKDFRTEKSDVLVADSPNAALALLRERGIETALIAGGGKLNGAFMEAGLVDELYLDVMPVALGQGIKLFDDTDFEAKLELLGTKEIAPKELQLHYKILK